ncbi:unnamed protein product [Diabrotica balteata]|uniref:HAT C-terminal dimerisation domain-containing protein n=1 Tax=Diabrotica balteata TaxID=107213 RepID=A0A9N9T855_DIABA|nr:unnamed protein product [Diabrotica balteata]
MRTEENIPRASTSKPSTSSNGKSSVPVSSCGVFSVSSKTRNIQGTISAYIPKKLNASQKKKYDDDLLEIFIFDYQPVSIVEDRGFKKFVSGLNPSYKLPNSHTISETMIPAEYETCFKKAKKEMKKLDNAANIKKAIQVELGWKFFGCFAHTLNLIVQDALALPAIKNVEKVKIIVSHFRRSASANTKLNSFQKQFGIDPPKKLIQEVVTRRSSTFYMLQRIVQLENPVRSVLGLLDDRLPLLEADQWILIKELCEVLTHFEEATKSISGETYISASLVIVLQRGLVNVCEKLKLKTFSEPTIDIIQCLEDGLRQRVGNVEYSNTLALCTFLDPRFKTFAFVNNDAIEAIRKLVTNIVTEMITKDAKRNENTETETSNQDRNENKSTTLSVLNCLHEKVSKNKPKTTPSSSRAIMEIPRYLEDDVLQTNANPLTFWKSNQYNFPYLNKLVKQKCCALATSVPCERLFSDAQYVLGDRHTRLNHENLSKILFLRTYKLRDKNE